MIGNLLFSWLLALFKNRKRAVGLENIFWALPSSHSFLRCGCGWEFPKLSCISLWLISSAWYHVISTWSIFCRHIYMIAHCSGCDPPSHAGLQSPGIINPFRTWHRLNPPDMLDLINWHSMIFAVLLSCRIKLIVG